MKKILLSLALVATVQLCASNNKIGAVNPSLNGLQTIKAELLKGFYLRKNSEEKIKPDYSTVLLVSGNCLIDGKAYQLDKSAIVKILFSSMTCRENGDTSVFLVSGYVTNDNYVGIKGKSVNVNMELPSLSKNINQNNTKEYLPYIRIEAKKDLVSIIKVDRESIKKSTAKDED